MHGVGAALIFPVATAVASSTFTGARQARAIGVVLGVAAIGQALGPFVGGTFSFDIILLAGAALALVGAVGLLVFGRPRGSPLDPASASA